MQIKHKRVNVKTTVDRGTDMDNMSNINEQLSFEHEKRLKDLIPRKLISTCIVNLTHNQVEDVCGYSLTESMVAQIKTFEDAARYTLEAILSDEERAKYKELTKRAYWLNAYQEGKTTFSLDYRVKMKDGKIRWVSETRNILRNPENGDIYFFGYVSDANERKKRELAYPERIEYDEYTGLYKDTTAEGMINMLLQESFESNRLNAFFNCRLLNYEKIKGKYGTLNSHKILAELGRMVRLYLENRYILSYRGDGLLSVYIIEAESQQKIMKEVNSLIDILSLRYIFPYEDMQLKYRINLVYREKEDDTFWKLDEKAKYIDRSTDPASRAICEVYKSKSVEYLGNYHNNLEFMQQLSLCGEATAMAILKATAALVSAETLKEAIDFVLQMLCDYYEADRSQVYEMGNDLCNFNGIYDYCRDGVQSVAADVCRERIESAPSFLRAFETKQTLVLNNIADTDMESDTESDFLNAHGIHSLYMAPFHIKGKMTGFVSVDNVSAHLGEVIFLNAMAYFIPNEIVKRRLMSEQDYIKHYDMLTELENRNSYQKYVNAIKQETLAALGVVCIDINGLKDINTHFGTKVGDGSVRYVADMLRRFFSDGKLYRLGGGMFLALCGDYAHDTFEESVSEMKRAIAKNEEISISVGHCWSSNDIDIEKMVGNAEDLMLIAKQDYYQREEKSNQFFRNKLQQELKQTILDGEFVMYLQPKADIATKRINGAEALVRRIHPQHGVIPPNKFIPLLEKENLVRYIDIFIFEEVLKTLTRWLDEGKRVFPISLNFSRATMLEPDIINSMERVHEKYNVPHDLIEIEITETLGNMERATIEAIGCKIVKNGYRLSLDDFGASFSNLSILNTMQFDVLKLDKSIINHIVTEDKSRIIIKKVLELCNELGIESIAEGVETEEQFEILKKMGCAQAQGYLFNKPIPVSDFEDKYMREA